MEMFRDIGGSDILLILFFIKFFFIKFFVTKKGTVMCLFYFYVMKYLYKILLDILVKICYNSYITKDKGEI